MYRSVSLVVFEEYIVAVVNIFAIKGHEFQIILTNRRELFLGWGKRDHKRR